MRETAIAVKVTQIERGVRNNINLLNTPDELILIYSVNKGNNPQNDSIRMNGEV